MVDLSYEAWRAGQVVEMVKSNPNYINPTHRHVINTLEALHLSTVASWYWQDLVLTCDEDLDIRLA